MSVILDELSADHDQVFLRGDALRYGLDDRSLARLRHGGAVHRIRHGAYCLGDVWRHSNAEQRHLLLTRAVLRQTTGNVALSHLSAAVAHGLDMWHVPLHMAHVTRLDRRTGRLAKDVDHHVGAVPDESDLGTIHGMPSVVPARAVVECGLTLPTESALVLGDSALRKQLCTLSDLQRYADEFTHWSGHLRLHMLLRRMSSLHGSAAESRAAYLFHRAGFPPPVCQYEIWEHGVNFASVDFAWPELKLIVEVDGKSKYLDHLRPGESPGDAVFREKTREDRIRRVTGWRVIRLTWADLDNPAACLAAIRRAFAEVY